MEAPTKLPASRDSGPRPTAPSPATTTTAAATTAAAAAATTAKAATAASFLASALALAPAPPSSTILGNSGRGAPQRCEDMSVLLLAQGPNHPDKLSPQTILKLLERAHSNEAQTTSTTTGVAEAWQRASAIQEKSRPHAAAAKALKNAFAPPPDQVFVEGDRDLGGPEGQRHGAAVSSPQARAASATELPTAAKQAGNNINKTNSGSNNKSSDNSNNHININKNNINNSNSNNSHNNSSDNKNNSRSNGSSRGSEHRSATKQLSSKEAPLAFSFSVKGGPLGLGSLPKVMKGSPQAHPSSPSSSTAGLHVLAESSTSAAATAATGTSTASASGTAATNATATGAAASSPNLSAHNSPATASTAAADKNRKEKKPDSHKHKEKQRRRRSRSGHGHGHSGHGRHGMRRRKRRRRRREASDSYSSSSDEQSSSESKRKGKRRPVNGGSKSPSAAPKGGKSSTLFTSSPTASAVATSSDPPVLGSAVSVASSSQPQQAPGSFSGGLAVPSGGKQVGARGEWAEYHLQDGRSYYLNIKTGEKTWARPQTYENIASRRGATGIPVPAGPGSHSNVYVGGLPAGISEATFRQLFVTFGSIVSTKVVPELRYGFVKFTSMQEAQVAIDAMNGFNINGLALQVRFANKQ